MQNFPNSFFKENPLPRPYFWSKPLLHTPTKKLLETSVAHTYQKKKKYDFVI